MMMAARACQTKRRSIAWNAPSRSAPRSPRRTAGSTTVVTIATPPIQITTARTCNARAVTTPSMTGPSRLRVTDKGARRITCDTLGRPAAGVVAPAQIAAAFLCRR